MVTNSGVAKILGLPKISEPLSDNSSAIAISIYQDIRFDFYNTGQLEIKEIYFIKLEDVEDSLKKDEVIASNYYYIPFMAGFQVDAYDYFLLNVEPGTYAAVGAAADGIFLYLPIELIEKSIVTVEPNQMVYMGDFVLEKLSYKKPTIADEYQRYYNDNDVFDKAREWRGKMLVSHRRIPQFHAPNIEKMKRTCNSEIKFLKKRSKLFRNSKWIGAIDNRLKYLTQK